MYVYSYLKTATSIIEQYNGEVPLSIHLKTYFKLNKKFGGRDRKQISHFCYCFYRTGNLFKKEGVEEKLKKSIFLCTTNASLVLQQIDAAYYENATLSFEEKLAFLKVPDKKPMFPMLDAVSSTVDKNLLIQNHLLQPYLYIRIRPKHLAAVLIRIAKLGVAYNIIDPYTIQLPNGFDVANHFEIDKEVVIQDYSSQMVFQNLLQLISEKQYFKVWDCCAASGGKSILIHDSYNGKLDLFVTDIRTTILDNLSKRFFTARLMNYKVAGYNLFKKPLDTNDVFDIIICDAPCSGSGTWGRTPEYISFFKQKHLDEFNVKQKTIAKNAAKSLKPNGWFVYITCSVFAAENEAIANYIATVTGFSLHSMQCIEGYKSQADTMFVALLQNNVIS